MEAKDIFFYFFSAIVLAFAIRVVTAKKPIDSAFSLVLVFFGLAADFMLLEAHMIGILQILVYAGAIMVLFVFVIMLLNDNVKDQDMGRPKNRVFQAGSAVMCAALAGLVIFATTRGEFAANKGNLTPGHVASLGGNTQAVSTLMFSDYILPFELTSVLLLVGIVGSVALAKRKVD